MSVARQLADTVGRLSRVLSEADADGVLAEVKDRFLRLFVPISVMVVAWWAASVVYADPQTLPGPVHVASLTWEFMVTEGPYGHTALFHLGRTLYRIVINVVLTIGLAVLIGVWMGTNRRAEAVFSSWLPLGMTAPTVIIVLIMMVWFGFSEIALFVAVIIGATPFATIVIWKGMKNIDTRLIEMANAFDADDRSVFRHIYIPHLMPFIFAAVRYIMSMVWGMTALAEVFGLSTGIGVMFSFWFGNGNIPALLAYVLLFVPVMLVLEHGILGPVGKVVFKWRPESF